MVGSMRSDRPDFAPRGLAPVSGSQGCYKAETACICAAAAGGALGLGAR